MIWGFLSLHHLLFKYLDIFFSNVKIAVMRKQDLEFTPIHQHRQRRKEYLNALKDRLCRSHILHPWMYPFSSKGNLKHLPHLPWHSYSKLHTKTKPNVFLTYTVRAACQHLGWIHPWREKQTYGKSRDRDRNRLQLSTALLGNQLLHQATEKPTLTHTLTTVPLEMLLCIPFKINNPHVY